MGKLVSDYNDDALRLSERKFKAIFTMSLDAIVITDDLMQIRDVNPAASTLFQKDKESLLKKKFPSLFVEEEKNEIAAIWNRMKRKGMYRGEATLDGDETNRKIVEYTAVADFLPERNLFFLRDITDRRIEEKRRDHFVAVAGHELKSPLASVKAMAQLLRRKVAKGTISQGFDYFDKIDEKVEIITRLINDLLDITRIRQGKMDFNYDFFEFDQFLSELVEEMRVASKTHKIIIDGNTESDIVADRTRIAQVVRNLIKNAVRYSPIGSTIHVESRVASGNIFTCVSDEGPGIPARDRKKIFNLYYRGDQQQKKPSSGLGLGLYISAEIIKQHKGKIWVEGMKKTGAMVCFSLPVNPRVSKTDRKIF